MSIARRHSADHVDDRPAYLETAEALVRRLWRSGWWLPLLLTLPALAPLLQPGFYVSDDGLFHVYRIAALADAWQHGALYPRLFPQFGFGYGQAVFNFYAPLSYAPGALLSVLGVSPEVSAEWTVALGFVLASLSAYGMGKYVWGRAGGVLAAVIYTYFPYHLADAYLRGALPEHMAFVFLPLIVWTTVAAFREEHPVPAYLWSALAWCALAYTHNLTLLLMAPAWAALALALALRTGRWNRFWGSAGGALLGAGLSAALWLPFLAESKGVGIGLGPSDGYQRHLAPLGQLVQALPFYQYRVSHGTGVAEHPLGWPAALFAVFALGRLVVAAVRRRPLPHAGYGWYGLGLASVAVLMTAAPALPAWRLMQPVLGQLQYPWRFMTLAALGLALRRRRARMVRTTPQTERYLPAGSRRSKARDSLCLVWRVVRPLARLHRVRPRSRAGGACVADVSRGLGHGAHVGRRRGRRTGRRDLDRGVSAADGQGAKMGARASRRRGARRPPAEAGPVRLAGLGRI